MRYTLVLTAAVLFAPANLRAADPPITFQTSPVERVLDDIRTAAKFVGGDKAVKEFNASIKDKFGEKGFDGLDLGKPIVGYVNLALKPEDITAVLVVPVTGEKEFFALMERGGDKKPKDLGKGLYQIETSGDTKELMRFSDGHVYFAIGTNPEPALDPKALVAPSKIYKPTEKAALAVTFHFDRITPEMKKAALTWLAEAKKKLAEQIDANDPMQAALKPALAEVEKLAIRYLALLEGADAASVKVGLDKATGEAYIDGTLTPKPGTQLAKEIAARKPAQNRFAGLFTADTVAGLKYTAPLFAEEIRNAFGIVSEQQQKDLLNVLPAEAKATIEELMKGQARTLKSGEGDFALAVRGPNKNGHYTAVAATSFDDPSALEKELKKFMQKEPPPENIGAFKWDAAKAGNVSIHTFKFNAAELPPPVKVFGDDATLAFAFAPKGIYVAFGPDPIATVKDAMNAKPAESAALEVVLNPAKLGALVEKFGGNAFTIEQAIGKDDKLISAGSLKVLSGKELTVRFALNLKVLPRAIYESGIVRD